MSLERSGKHPLRGTCQPYRQHTKQKRSASKLTFEHQGPEKPMVDMSAKHMHGCRAIMRRTMFYPLQVLTRKRQSTAIPVSRTPSSAVQTTARIRPYPYTYHAGALKKTAARVLLMGSERRSRCTGKRRQYYCPFSNVCLLTFETDVLIVIVVVHSAGTGTTTRHMVGGKGTRSFLPMSTMW